MKNDEGNQTEEKHFGKSIDWSMIVSRLEALATSETARSHLRALRPLKTAEDATHSFAQIEEAREILTLGERPYAESIDLFASWHSRLKRDAVLQTIELRDARRFCIEIVALEAILKLFAGSWARSIANRLMQAKHPLSAIDQLMTPSGEIRNDASEALYNLHREQASQIKALHGTLDRLVKAHEMEPVVQERFVTTREGRWLYP